jgi:hypothetical protein
MTRPVLEREADLLMHRFNTPMDDGQVGEQIYQDLRREVASQMGRPPNQRRIKELWSRRGSVDCVTAVGSPDPIWGGTVTAIFDMGPHRPFIVYRQHSADPDHQAFDVLDCNAYSVSEFAA